MRSATLKPKVPYQKGHLTVEQSAFPSTRPALSDDSFPFLSIRGCSLTGISCVCSTAWCRNGNGTVQKATVLTSRKSFVSYSLRTYSRRRNRSPSHAVAGASTSKTPMTENDWHARNSDLQKQGALPCLFSDATFPSGF